MIYLSKQVKFKKQSQTINTIIKDKQILDKKKKIKSLMKTDAHITNQLTIHRQQYEEVEKYHLHKHQELISKEKVAKELLLKTIIRKFRLQAIENNQINRFFGNSIKNYLKTFAQCNKLIFVCKLGGTENYLLIKKYILRLQTLHLIKPERRKIVFKKLIKIWVRNRVFQYVMVSVKEKDNSKLHKRYVLSIYSTESPYFQLSLEISQEEFNQKVRVKNPQENLIINLNKMNLMFLDDYFKIGENIEKLKTYSNIYKFQIQVIKSKKNIVFFKCLTIQNIFQTVYSMSGYENLSLRVLMSIKKEPRKIQNTRYISFQNNLSNSQSAFHKKFNEQNFQYCLYCEPLQSYDKKFMFSIKDDTILTEYQGNFQQFLPIFLKKYLIQLNVKKIKREDSLVNEDRGIKTYQQLQVEAIPARIVSVIDFSQNIRKIIAIQSFFRMSLNRKRFLNELRNLKKSMSFEFKCKIVNNIMVSALIKNEQVMFFVQCMSLSAQKRKNSYDSFLHYDKKYWGLVLPFINSIQFLSILKKYLIWEIQDNIDEEFREMIRRYEEQEVKIKQMKPIKALNRLRRFFIRCCLKTKAKKNIYHVQKIQKQSAIYVLIIRKCPLLKNIANAYLYKLKTTQNILKKASKNKKGNNLLKTNLINFESSRFIEQKQKKSYQPISMFLQNALAFLKINQLSLHHKIKKSNQINGKFIQNQFYITQNHFLLKPLHLENLKGVYKFIERLACISLCSEQIKNQINFLNLGRNHKQIFQAQLRKTLTPSRSIQNITKKSASSIVFDKVCQEQKLQYDNLIFYTIYKDEKGLFYLQLFLIICGEFNSHFKPVHKEQISKKDVASSSWTFIYRLISIWVKKSGWCINWEQKKNANAKQLLGSYIPSYHLFQENTNQSQKQQK